MRVARLILPLFVIGLASAGVAALVMAPTPLTKPVVATSDSFVAVTSTKAPKENTARDVGAGTVPTPVLPDAPLERIAPAPNQKSFEAFGPPIQQLGKEEPFLLFQPLVENAGTLIAEGRIITLVGVLPVEASFMCTDTKGNLWPCGRQARTAFRALVRGRAISCLLPDQQKSDVETECSIGKENLGEWLVEHGWAEAKPGSDLENLGKAAKLMGRGIYGQGT